MEPVYRYIEFCRNPDTLWGKMQSGHWDWLGVHPGGQFVLGRPARSRGPSVRAAPTVVGAEAPEGAHGIRVWTDPRQDGPAGREWFASEKDADKRYAELVSHFKQQPGPLMVRVERIEQREVVQDETIFKKPSTYL